MAQEVDANEFYDSLTSGGTRSKDIVLEMRTGEELHGVKMNIVEKKFLAEAINSMPDEIFSSLPDNVSPSDLEGMSQEEQEKFIEEAQQRVDEASDEAEDTNPGSSTASVLTSELIAGFTLLCDKSLSHPDLAPQQIQDIVDELSLEAILELGSEILEFSIENTGKIRGFRNKN